MERERLVEVVRQSGLGGVAADLLREVRPIDWLGALTAVAGAVPADEPSIVVLDEVPWLIEQDRAFEGALQTVWDGALSRKPVLLVLIGSDISVMESLQTYERPFFGRALPMRVDPLNLADVQDMARLDAVTAVDALLMTGGFPEIVQSWRPGNSRAEFLEDAMSQPLTPLLTAGELTLLGEFPDAVNARTVIEAIGAFGERTFSGIAARAGGANSLPSGVLTPILATLRHKHVVAVDQPLSTRLDAKNKRYRIEDTYLRFWLGFLEQAVGYVERGRGDVALRRIERDWSAWRGRAVEPIVRASVQRLLPDEAWPDVVEVGGWWNRQNNPEIDLIGTPDAPVARSVEFAGSIKWHENRSFTADEFGELARSATVVPGVADSTPLVAVSRCGFDPGLSLAAAWTPEDLVNAWR